MESLEPDCGGYRTDTTLPSAVAAEESQAFSYSKEGEYVLSQQAAEFCLEGYTAVPAAKESDYHGERDPYPVLTGGSGFADSNISFIRPSFFLPKAATASSIGDIAVFDVSADPPQAFELGGGGREEDKRGQEVTSCTVEDTEGVRSYTVEDTEGQYVYKIEVVDPINDMSRY